MIKTTKNGQIDRNWPRNAKSGQDDQKMAKNGQNILNGYCQENSENMKKILK